MWRAAKRQTFRKDATIRKATKKKTPAFQQPPDANTPEAKQLQLTSTLRPMNRRRIAQLLERRRALVQGESPQPPHAREREAEGVEDTLWSAKVPRKGARGPPFRARQ